MTYSALVLLVVPVVIGLDLLVLRTRLVLRPVWWLSYAVVLFFQLLTNGWLTGRRIVRYDGDAILGDAAPQLIGNGRLIYAPIEDIGFGFALVLLTCAVWVRLGHKEIRAT